MIERIRYFIREGLRNIWVNRMMSLASILVLCICLLMLGTTFLTSLNINSFLANLESKNQIMVYLNKDVDDTKTATIEKTIKQLPNVKTALYLSKDEIFSDAKETLGKQDILLNGIDSSAFDAAYQVELNDLSLYSETVASLEKIDGVKYVRQDEGLASMLTNVRKAVNMTGFWLVVIMAIISLFIISNTIKLALFSRKREVNIMKFVGATDWFIRLPFIIEGAIIGLISGLIALLIQYLVYTKLIENLINMINITKPLAFSTQLYVIVPAFLISGAVVGMLGSIVSLRKHLRV